MANYTAPSWVDDNPPALNAENMQALSDAVEKAQTLEGSGAPTTSTAAAVGQYYYDTTTTPYTRYKCTAQSGSAYTWVLDCEIISVDFGTLSASGASTSATVSNANITADHVVLNYSVGTPSAQVGDLTVTTAAGSVTVGGTIDGSTTITVLLGIPGLAISA